jgi:Tfp pilus assembly protein PilF
MLALAQKLTTEKEFATAILAVGAASIAVALYQRASGRQPAATSLQLTYGRILYETKQYQKARAAVVPLLPKEPGSVEALTMLGIMAYNKNQLPQTTRYLNQVLATYPDNPTAQAFAQKIQAARAPYSQLYQALRSRPIALPAKR